VVQWSKWVVIQVAAVWSKSAFQTKLVAFGGEVCKFGGTHLSHGQIWWTSLGQNHPTRGTQMLIGTRMHHCSSALFPSQDDTSQDPPGWIPLSGGGAFHVPLGQQCTPMASRMRDFVSCEFWGVASFQKRNFHHA